MITLVLLSLRPTTASDDRLLLCAIKHDRTSQNLRKMTINYIKIKHNVITVNNLNFGTIFNNYNFVLKT